MTEIEDRVERKAMSLGEKLWNVMSDPASTAWTSMGEAERGNFERIAATFTRSTVSDLTAPPFADGGIGNLMLAGGQAYLDEYVLATEGDDHEPTEFERVLLEDFMAGLMNDEAMFGPVRALLARLQAAEAALTAAEGEKEHYRNNGHQQALRARDAEARATASEARAARLEEAIRWALGEGEDFPQRESGQGAYWWRTELRLLAALAPPTTSKPEGGEA